MDKPEVQVARRREKLRVLKEHQEHLSWDALTSQQSSPGEEDTQWGVLTSQRSQPASEGSGGSLRSQELKNHHPKVQHSGEEQMRAMKPPLPATGGLGGLSSPETSQVPGAGMRGGQGAPPAHPPGVTGARTATSGLHQTPPAAQNPAWAPRLLLGSVPVGIGRIRTPHGAPPPAKGAASPSLPAHGPCPTRLPQPCSPLAALPVARRWYCWPGPASAGAQPQPRPGPRTFFQPRSGRCCLDALTALWFHPKPAAQRSCGCPVPASVQGRNLEQPGPVKVSLPMAGV